MSTNEQGGKGSNWEGTPPSKTIAKAIENVAAKKTTEAQNLAKEIAKRRAEILSKNAGVREERGFTSSGPTPLEDETPTTIFGPEDIRDLNAARRAERARQEEIAKNANKKPTISNEVRVGGGVIDLDEMAIDTKPSALSSGSGNLEEGVATPDDLARTFNRLQDLHTPGQRGATSMTTLGKVTSPSRILSRPIMPPVEKIKSADDEFNETTLAFNLRLTQLRESMADIVSNETPPSAQLQTPQSKEKSVKIANLRKMFADFRNETAVSRQIPSPVHIPTLTEIVHPVDVNLGSSEIGIPLKRVDIPLMISGEHIDLPLEREQGEQNSYTPTYPVGLNKEAADSDHIDLPLEETVTEAVTPAPEKKVVPTVPAHLETKKPPVLHRRKVIRGNFFNLGIKKATAALHALTKKLSKIRYQNERHHKSSQSTHTETEVAESAFTVTDSTLEEFRKVLDKPYDGDVVDHGRRTQEKNEKGGTDQAVDTLHKTTPDSGASDSSLLEFIPKESNVNRQEDDEEDYPAVKKGSSWGTIMRAFKKETEQAKAARLRALQRSEKRMMEEEKKKEEEKLEAWRKRRERIERMITGEEELDEAFFRARFETIDKKTETIRESVLEKIGKEGVKLLSIFDKGANFLKNNVDTKTRVLAGAGMLAAAGISLYTAPVFATGAAISVVAAGMRVVSASGTYLTARALLEKMYKKAENEGRAYGNTEKVLFGAGAVLGSAALGTAVGQIFEHFFPAEKIANVLQHVGAPDIPVPTPEVTYVAEAPSIVPQAPVPDTSFVQSGIQNAITSIPFELTERVVKPGENLWSIIGDVMKHASPEGYEGFNMLDSHAKDVKILEVVGHVMKDPQAYGIKGGDINHIAQGVKLHLANAFIK